MKRALLVLVVLLQLSAPSAQAAIYQWIDAKGVTHFTDNPDKIPKAYQKKARRLELSEEPAHSRVSAPEPQSAPTGVNPQALEYGGHNEQWWRGRFSALRDELKRLQDGLPAKQALLVELRRKRVIFTRAQDRVAFNKMQDEISADETRISALQDQIATLELDAGKAGVPKEWR
jgi:hypothetical protein